MNPSPDDRASPFPLYMAPLTTCSNYTGPGQCTLCGRRATERLRLGIGADLIYGCPACGQPFAIPADTRDGTNRDGTNKECPNCSIPTHVRQVDGDHAVCFDCLRRGRASLTKDTEYGMVRWADAVRGRTVGVPYLRQAPGFSLTEPDDEGWVSVNIPSEILLELVRTPTYSTWQGEQWLFCCATAMVYLGEWTRADLARHAPDKSEDAFLDIFEDATPQMLEYLSSDRTDSGMVFYVFRCRTCGRHRGNFDMT